MKNFTRSGIVLLLYLMCGTMTAQFNYGEALQKSLFFYEVQQSGKLPDWNRVSWRGDSTMEDGSDVGLDLNGGWFDAGDHVKFNFPMAFSVTTLAWGGIEFEEAYQNSGQLDILKRNLRFVTDYFIKCHTAPNELYGQVGNGGVDHGWWGSPEVYPRERPSYKIDADNPGSDLAAETAAAMAAMSILIKADDPAYSATLVEHAKQLYDFADTYRDEYSNSITDAAGFYRSFSSYNDEIVWGAIWMYKATNDPEYLTKAEEEYDNLQKQGQSTTSKYKEAFSWDDKAYGCYLLLAQITGKEKYVQDIERNLDYFAHNVDGESVPTTPGGLPHIRQWGTVRYASNQSLLALIYGDKVTTDPVKQARYTGFAKRMVDYALGDNPINRSFMNGFGNNPANDPHHRANSGNWTNSDSGPPNVASHILYGAVVGGPKEPDNDNFVDDRGEFVANEVACDYNACITGVLARMYGEFGGDPLPDFPVDEVPTRAEIRSFSKFNSDNAFGSTISIIVQNRSAWPARVTDKLSYRYYFDIAEGVAEGKTIDDYAITLNGIGGDAKMTIKPVEGSVYYAEITDLPSIAPIGDPAFRTETQINIRVANGVPYDTSNDWSAQGIEGDAVESVNIPVYDNGVLVFGKEPNGGETPTASFTATPETGVAPLEVSFDASGSSDPNGDVITYSWDFGNGDTSTSATPTVTFTDIDTYTVTLTVSDGTNVSTPVTKEIVVLDSNIAPVADFTATPTTGIAPVTVSFDASASTDENGDDLTYSWDFGDETTATGVTADHLYATVGEYIVELTVSDGSKTSTKTATINVTDGSPVASFTLSTETGVAPLDVSFDASASSDPTGGVLTYSWDFGNTETATTAIASTTYSTVGEFTVTLTVTNASGDIDTETKIINVTDGSIICAFETPIAEALPSINTAFENIFVLGDNGPDLDNVSNFTINWDLSNNGLYQFSMNTTDGTPSYYVDFLPKVTQNFNAAEPAITIVDSGFTGLDGEYWATIDEGNFVLVSKTKGFTIYFSTSAVEPDCGNGGPVNTDPVANISATPVSGEVPLVVTFDASGSTDADGDTLTYSWDFGDTNTATGVTTENTYTAIGEYEVTLTVNDGNGGEDQAKITVRVNDDVIITPPIGDNAYINRFIDMRNEIYDPANGYFSADGSPHHSIESLIVEAPDHGHESTSELYSYWLWLEVMNGRVTKDWEPLSDVWNKIEEFIIPTRADQPTNSAYNPAKPAAYASEFSLPSNYPAPLNPSAPVGSDPISPDLTAAYGADIYQMHWLLDNDNFYGYGNRGDGVSTPSYINTFQRGEQESVYETVPHPSWEGFNWGGTNGFLPIFIEDQNYAKQWRYTSAPDADARAVQAMYWAQEYAKEQGTSLGSLNLDKASKMGDFLRLSMFDKYFKPLGVQSSTTGAGTGYDSAHYLMSWYMSWGGSADTSSPWAFRISSSHCHFGYQNPVAAYALTQVDELKPKSQNGERDWNESLKRQMEFYTWLQSKEGAIAGGATNSWNGDYSQYPAGKSTFYDMAFDTDPVYHDPGSGTWFGWQAWSMERVAEYYYITNDAMAKSLMDKWATWVKSEVKLIGSDDFEIPATLEWSGEPDTWNPESPGGNTDLSVTVVNYSQDLGVAASMAKALIYYAAATEKHATLDTESRDLAKEVLDRMWTTYRDDKGVSAPESRGDYNRIFEEEVYIPEGFTGTMANGDEIKPGVTFLDIRSDLKNDPDYDRLKTAYDNGTDFTQRYHRTWAQMEVALANAEYGFFFGEDEDDTASVTIATPVATNQKPLKVSVSPNPTKNYINILVDNKVTSKSSKSNIVRIQLTDLQGNILRGVDIKNTQRHLKAHFEVGNLPPGMYFLQTFDFESNEKVTKKVMIE